VPGVPKTLGLGGLGLEGIVGSEEYDGEWETPPAPGVGKSGLSGDWVGETRGALAGAADMEVTCIVLCWEIEAMANEQLHANKAINIAKNDQKEAINDRRINILPYDET